jgi:GNAT superfamily N-acetyltransferase
MDASLREGAIDHEWAALQAQTVLVALDKCAIAGFIHLGHQAADSGNDAYVVIRFFAYRRGQRHVGDALLVAAESWMQGRGLKQSKVMPQPWRYPFYGFPHSYMSDHLDHIQALLRYRGFNKSGGEVFLDWLDMQPVKVSDSSGFNYELQVEDSPGAGRLPGLKVRAMKGDAQIGQCLLDSGAESSTADEAHEFAFCNILGVEESYQGSGLGRFLLAHAMCLAKERGYRHGAISTAYDNDRTFLFYSNHGFRVADWTYEFTRNFG